jgi:membrane-associated phospholipid phosphatase
MKPPLPSPRCSLATALRPRPFRVAALIVLVLFPAGLFSADPAAFALHDRPVEGFALSRTASGGAAALPEATSSRGSGEFSIHNLTRDFLKDAGQIWSYPFHIRTDDILPIIGLAAVTGLVIANDESIFRGFQDYYDDHGWVQDASPVITKMGSWGAWATAGLFLGVGLIGGEHKPAETGVLAATAMMESSLLVWFLKGMTGRQRPSYADGVDHWSGPAGFFKRYQQGYQDAYDSFPSGHAITAFSLATVVAMEYQETVWVPILSYAVATGVGLSRVTLSRHWLSDVLVGGVLGHLIGRLVVRNHRRRYHAIPAVSVSPRSVSLAFSF